MLLRVQTECIVHYDIVAHQSIIVFPGPAMAPSVLLLLLSPSWIHLLSARSTLSTSTTLPLRQRNSNSATHSPRGSLRPLASHQRSNTTGARAGLALSCAYTRGPRDVGVQKCSHSFLVALCLCLSLDKNTNFALYETRNYVKIC